MTNATATDASGNGNNGSLTNMTTRANAVIGKIGQGLSFNAANINVVSVPNNTIFNSYPISYGIWFKTSLNSGSRAGFISKYQGGSSNGWELGIVNRRLYSFYLNPSAGVGPSVDFVSPGFINDGKWHMAMVTIDESGGSMYLDGDLIATKSWTGTPTQATTANTLLMGLATGNTYYSGSLDDARVYNRVLSHTEVKAVYKLGGGR